MENYSSKWRNLLGARHKTARANSKLDKAWEHDQTQSQWYRLYAAFAHHQTRLEMRHVKLRNIIINMQFLFMENLHNKIILPVIFQFQKYVYIPFSKYNSFLLSVCDVIRFWYK